MMLTVFKNFAIFIILITFLLFKRSENQTLSFRSVGFGGSSLCAVDNPSSSASTDDIVNIDDRVPGAVRCGFLCTQLNRQTGCLGFNYLTADQSGRSQCQFFNSAPIVCRYSLNCTYYEVSERRICYVVTKK